MSVYGLLTAPSCAWATQDGRTCCHNSSQVPDLTMLPKGMPCNPCQPLLAIYTRSSRLLSEPAARFGTAGLVPCGDAHCPSQRPGRSRCLLSSSASYQHPTTARGSDNEHALCPHPAGPARNEGTAANQPHTCILGLPRVRMSRVSRVEAPNDPSGRPRTVLAGFPGALAQHAARSRICTQALPLRFPRPAGPVFCTSPHSQGPRVRCSAWVVGNQLTHTAR